MGFTTSLVGVNPDNTASSPLYTWSWISTYNGDVGGFAETASSQPVNGSGTGGVTITSVNGVPQSPATVTCTATPSKIVLKEHSKSFSVTLSGNITAGTSPLVSSTYSITTQKGLLRGSGGIATSPQGAYSFAVTMGRAGIDDKARFNVMIRATDSIGNVRPVTLS
jgi:hypothetical protein